MPPPAQEARVPAESVESAPSPATTELAPAASQSQEPKCASCEKSEAHTLPELSLGEFHEQLERFASEPLAGGSPGLETLLFHNTRTREYLSSFGAAALDDEHRAFLEHQLARDHAIVAIRIIDAEGVERLNVGPTRVPLRTRKHLRSSRTVNLQAAELSGTVVRVGLDRLWVRY